MIHVSHRMLTGTELEASYPKAIIPSTGRCEACGVNGVICKNAELQQDLSNGSIVVEMLQEKRTLVLLNLSLVHKMKFMPCTISSQEHIYHEF